MITITILLSLLLLINSYIIKQNNNYRTLLNMAQIRYEIKNEKDLVKKSNIIFLAPMNNFSMEEAELFKKSIPENWEYSVLTGNKIIEAIDGTPFCLLSSIISSSNFCIFIFDDDLQKSNEILNSCLTKVFKILKSSNTLIVDKIDGTNEKIIADKVMIATGSEPSPFPGIPFDEKIIVSSTGALSLQ
jgi:hypothetical protein